MVSHSLSLRPFTGYVIDARACTDCIDGLTAYWPMEVTDDYDKAAYYAKLKALKAAPNRALNGPLPCSRTTEPSVLLTRLGNVHLTAIGEQLEGYVDILAKTNTEARALQQLSATVLVDTEFFGDYGISTESLQLELIGELQNSYQTLVSDSGEGSINLSTTLLADATQVAVLDTLYQSLLRLHFSVPVEALGTLGTNNDATLVELADISGAYACRSGVTAFDKGFFEEGDVKVVIEGMATERIEYAFDFIYYSEIDREYKFSVLARSLDNATIFEEGVVEIDLGTDFFRLNQFMDTPSAEYEINPSIAANYNIDGSDVPLSGNAIEITINKKDGVPLSQMLNLPTTDFVSLFDLTLVTSPNNCSPLEPGTMPLIDILTFREGGMQGLSSYVEEQSNGTALSIPYNQVVAVEDLSVGPCGDCPIEPVIVDFYPKTIIAGSNEVLTIIGSGFGDFTRLNPSENGSGSSVLFRNGDGDNPLRIGAGAADFVINDVIAWSDSEIQVRVPSTDWVNGFSRPASSGTFLVRNSCNNTTVSNEELYIPYARSNYRISRDGIAKPLGLRNEGTVGSLPGYTFAFNPNTDPSNASSLTAIDIKAEFVDALGRWCDETAVNFNTADGYLNQNIELDANDNISTVAVGDIGAFPSSSDPTAGVFKTFTYYNISCEDPTDDYSGGFIVKDIDIIVNDDAVTNAGNSSTIEGVLLHELGHAHQLAHARCSVSCSDGEKPLMKPGANPTQTINAVIQDVDAEGGLGVLSTSAAIVANNTCGVIPTADGQVTNTIAIQPIGTGFCNGVADAISVNTTTLMSEDEYLLFPNPASTTVQARNGPQCIQSLRITDLLGRHLISVSDVLPDVSISLEGLEPGSYIYFLTDCTGKTTSSKLIVQ